MDDLTASILILLVVSPSIVVLFVLMARGVRDIWNLRSFNKGEVERASAGFSPEAKFAVRRPDFWKECGRINRCAI
jgi:hypothetical protein